MENTKVLGENLRSGAMNDTLWWDSDSFLARSIDMEHHWAASLPAIEEPAVILTARLDN